MMEKQNDPGFLPFFFQEPVYIVSEPKTYVSVSDPQNEEKDSPVVEKVHFLGENRKQILVLVDSQEADFISEAENQLLNQILKAVNLTINDIAIVNISKVSLPSDTLISHVLKTIPFHTLISFTSLVKHGPTSNFFSKYVVTTDDANRKLLLADRLQELANNPGKKRLLWQCLQQLFLG